VTVPQAAPDKEDGSMNVTIERPVRIIGAFALIAILTGTQATALLGAPGGGKGKKPTSEFVIKTDELWGIWGADGTFQVTGAIEDSGWCALNWSLSDYLYCYGEQGTIVIDFFSSGGNSLFIIVDGTAVYEQLIGVVGTASKKVSGYKEKEETWKIRRTLEGSLPES
jgi:hypothetical protein